MVVLLNVHRKCGGLPFYWLRWTQGFSYDLILSLSDNPSHDYHGHSEPSLPLRINSAKDLRIVRPTVWNDLVRQPLWHVYPSLGKGVAHDR